MQRRTKDSGDIEHLLAGHRETEFHMITEATHAAFNARLNQTNGYGCAAGPEAAAWLCPDAAKSGKFSKDSYIALNRVLETANGGAYHWDRQSDVLARPGKARKVAEQVDGTGDGGVHFESTNIGFIFLQQPSIMATWWAPYEAKFKIGLANRS